MVVAREDPNGQEEVAAPESLLVGGGRLPQEASAMADDVVIAQRKPYAVDVEPGVYWWCACGRSTSQPFCSGAHKGTGLAPQKVEIAEKSTAYFCGCKHSKTPPRCDGTHKTLPATV
jgi:CDGSH iron-sulfur domain-containing protein 3